MHGDTAWVFFTQSTWLVRAAVAAGVIGTGRIIFVRIEEWIGFEVRQPCVTAADRYQ
jgi:hypothetical protein